MSRITDGLRHLAAKFSAERHEFARDMQPGGEMLLEGLVSKGYALHKGGRYALSEAGRRWLADVEPTDEG